MLIEQQLTPAVWDRDQLDALEAAGEHSISRQLFKAVSNEVAVKIKIHLKIDTGMGRLGAPVTELAKLLAHMRKLKHVNLEGVFSHYASAEVIDSPLGEEQEKEFAKALEIVEESGFYPECVHMANSAGLIHAGSLKFPAGKALVRPGIALYGYALPIVTASGNSVPGFTMSASLPSYAGIGKEAGSAAGERSASQKKIRELFKMPEQQRQAIANEFIQAHSLRPALTWKTRTMQVRQVKKGQALGYNGAFVTQRPSTIAALPVGYADGLNRLLSNKGRVILRDQYAPIVGRVSMDITLIDVTGVQGVSVGDEVLLIGRSQSCRIDAWEHAYHCGTIPYEVLCNISKRVPRVAVEEPA